MILKQLRSLSKRETFELESLAKYLSKSELKDVKRKLKNREIKIEYEKLPISFLISGENIIPKLNPYNERIKQQYFANLEKEFSSRAYDVLPNFIAQKWVGLTIEKRAAAALLFTNNLKIAIVKYGQDILDFLSYFELEKGRITRVINLKEVTINDYDFVFAPKKPYASAQLLFEPSEVQVANLEFIKRYAAHAREISVQVPKNLDTLIDKFGNEHIKELARALARMELRNKLCNKDVARAFEIASASIQVS